MGISEDANAAADYIEKYGWDQGNFTTPEGHVCLLGGLARGDVTNVSQYTHVDQAHNKYINPSTQAIAEHLGVGAGHLAEWNDEKDRTQDEVIQVLRDVATKHMPDAMRSENNEH